MPPPSSQHLSGFNTQLSDGVDLSEDQKKCCDDIISKLSDANGTKELPNAASRSGLWKRVFANSWDTDCPNKHPGSIRARRGVESMTKIGTWRITLPAPATPTKRKRNNDGQPNPVRLAGASAFIKPNINWDDFGISFTVCDANNASANAKYVTLNPGWTLQQARAEAMIHWDENESERVIEYNFKLAVYWARSRLLATLRESQKDGNEDQIGGGNEITVNTDELVKLVTCGDRMKEMAVLVDESNRIAKAWPVTKRTLA